MPSDSLCPSEDSKGFEALSLLRELSTHPQILEKSGLSLFQEAGVVIRKSRQLGPLATSATLTPIVGAHLQLVCYLPPPGCSACLSTADVDGQGVLGGKGRVSQLGKGRRGQGLSPPCHSHVGTHVHRAPACIWCPCSGMDRDGGSQCRQGGTQALQEVCGGCMHQSWL